MASPYKGGRGPGLHDLTNQPIVPDRTRVFLGLHAKVGTFLKEASPWDEGPWLRLGQLGLEAGRVTHFVAAYPPPVACIVNNLGHSFPSLDSLISLFLQCYSAAAKTRFSCLLQRLRSPSLFDGPALRSSTDNLFSIGLVPPHHSFFPPRDHLHGSTPSCRKVG